MTVAREVLEQRGYLVLPTSLLITSILFIFYWEPRLATSGDAVFYLAISHNPLDFVAAPFSYRFLVPAVVGVLPGSHEISFIVITILSISATSYVLFKYLCTIVKLELAAIGSLLFLLSPASTFSLVDPYLVDPVSFLCMALVFLLVAQGRWTVAAITFGVGVLVKETILLLLLPLTALAISRRFRPIGGWSLLLAGGFLVYGLLHYSPLLFGEIKPNYPYLTKDTFDLVVDYQRANYGSVLSSLLMAIFESFSFLWIAAGVGLFWLWKERGDQRGRALTVSSSLLVVPALLSLVVATDWVRMLSLAFVAVIPLALVRQLKPMVYPILLSLYGLQSAVTWRPVFGSKIWVEAVVFVGGGSAYWWGTHSDAEIHVASGV